MGRKRREQLDLQLNDGQPSMIGWLLRRSMADFAAPPARHLSVVAGVKPAYESWPGFRASVLGDRNVLASFRQYGAATSW